MRTTLPSVPVMRRAFVERDSSYEGVFFTGVKTTGIFCRPTCSARKPRLENLEFFPNAKDALFAGYRPCRRCRPMEPQGEAPSWLRPLLDKLESDPDRKWKDSDLEEMALSPTRVRRWFRNHHGMTFHSYQRARRLERALQSIREGTGVARAAFEVGYESLSGFTEAVNRSLGLAPSAGSRVNLVRLTRILTPLGPMVAGDSEAGIALLEFADRPMLETQIRRVVKRLECVLVPAETPRLGQLREELAAYHEGDLSAVSVPLDLTGTDFQVRAWEYLRTIPAGETRTYAQQARAMGCPAAVRAVGRANGDNRISILVPCHRVVGSGGKLTGYGGGLWRKRYLLDHELKASKLNRPAG